MLYRHGDVLLHLVEHLPARVFPRTGATLARGEATGHSHRFDTPQDVHLWQHGPDLYVEVLHDHARLVHEEHHAITLPRGVYRVWMQREYSPEAIRRVVD
ncbi:hypothetical protein [Deinococcus pimensis]|uniref:hypothetical protein n=1 Tax=Deinococcus pimensis TaxID=309888 RepID=UPI000483F801|nr:hypothetical protein [Deinococcus pimensis]